MEGGWEGTLEGAWSCIWDRAVWYSGKWELKGARSVGSRMDGERRGRPSVDSSSIISIVVEQMLDESEACDGGISRPSHPLS